MIYVSTGGCSRLTFEQAIKNFSKSNIRAFELSGGVFCENLEEKLQTISHKHSITLHNYFPPPQKPYVFNLASLNPNIVNMSMQHARNVIRLSSLIGAKYYSFHAGYLIDPSVNELGKNIQHRIINNRNTSKSLFIERVNVLSEYASRKNVKLLIENNVLSSSNYHEFSQNPLLMADYAETEEIISKVDNNVGLLIDVAHLKVSAQTLGFSREAFITDFMSKTLAYHLSDNAGLEDTNDPVSEKSWFWPLINETLDYYSLEIYNVTANQLKQQLDLVRKCLNLYDK